jgi:hypothetical protein
MGSSRASRRNVARSKSIDDPGEKLAMTCYIHFGDQDPDAISCETCLDFKQAVCPGENRLGVDCLRCMVDHSGNAIIETTGF